MSIVANSFFSCRTDGTGVASQAYAMRGVEEAEVSLPSTS
jgi:hypothetical protein